MLIHSVFSHVDGAESSLIERAWRSTITEHLTSDSALIFYSCDNFINPWEISFYLPLFNHVLILLVLQQLS